MRRGAGLAALVLAAGLAACGVGSGGPGSGPLTVYMSVPLGGPRAGEARAIADAARLTLARSGGRAGTQQVKLVVLDDTAAGGRWSLVATGADARRATEDANAIAYIGELDQAATRTSAPITSAAEIPQLALGLRPTSLEAKTLVGLPPSEVGRQPAETGHTAIEFVLTAIQRAGKNGGDRMSVFTQLQRLVAPGVS